MDRGSPALSTAVTVEIKVLDVNDNSPVFSKSSYSVDMSEDAVEGSQVVEASAHSNLDDQESECVPFLKYLHTSILFFKSRDMSIQYFLCPGVCHRC